MSRPAAPATAPQLTPQIAEVGRYFDAFASDADRWARRNRGYYRLIESVYRFLIPRGASCLEIGTGTGGLLDALEPSRGVGVDVSSVMAAVAQDRHPHLTILHQAGEALEVEGEFDYVVLSDLVGFAGDISAILDRVHEASHDETRIVAHSYSELWRPVLWLAERLRLKPRKPNRNWVTAGDFRNLLTLSGFEVVSATKRILFPRQVPILSTFLNGVLANVWPLNHLCLTWWLVARPVRPGEEKAYTVSVVVPARNERGMIGEIVDRVPELGAGTEIVFVEGGSSDGTWGEIERQIALHPERAVRGYRQQNRGKGDAVRLGFAKADGEILMILDADLTVAPEELTKFYRAVATGRCDLANGSRLVYDLAPGAMRFLNLMGNKFFSWVFSYLLDQQVKDTLCGTKVLRRSAYERIASNRSEFGDFDPFGDFDLLLGAVRAGLKIVDVPIRYGARTYGETNISRFRHGSLLFQMAATAFWKLKVQPLRVTRRD